MDSVFENRRAAGRELAAHLRDYAGRADVTVLALPRGGVPVAFEVAQALHAPLDILVVRKLGLPDQPELAMGAIGSGGAFYLDERIVAAAGVGQEALEIFGSVVHHEESADAAFALLGEGYGFDLVLSDVQMPGRMNGIDLAEQIMRRLPGQRLVLMTGYADELERARHLNVPILAKPFDMDDLVDVIAPGVPHG